MSRSTDVSSAGSYLDQIAALSFESERWTRERILEVRDFLSPWNHNIDLGHGVFTAACEDYYPAHREMMRIVAHELRGEFRGRRILDLGCLEGYFATECALQGAEALGVDGKLINVKKCEFVRSVLDVPGLRFVLDDAMAVTRERYGQFDAVLALGLLYHLDDPFTFLEHLAGLCTGFVLIDTHVALVDQPESIKGSWQPELSELREIELGGRTYRGRLFREFAQGATREAKDLSVTASLDNETSVWLTEDSLVTLLRDVGFEDVSKKVFPRSQGAWWSDERRDSRVLLVAVRERTPFRSRIFPAG